jgi:hypothetical protein
MVPTLFDAPVGSGSVKRQQPGERSVEGGGIEQEVEGAQKWDEDEQSVDAVPDRLPSLRHRMSIAGSRDAASPCAKWLGRCQARQTVRQRDGGSFTVTRCSHSRKQ